jgi:signal transduction histidine kinase
LWSKVNIDKVEALIAAGRMRPPGLAEISAAKADGRWEAAYESQRDATVPPDLAAALEGNQPAGRFFASLAKTDRYLVILRLTTARTPAACAARVAGADATVFADPDRVVQGLGNLLGNAIKFSPPGATVWATVEPQHGEVLVRVKDQGRGIPADKLEAIFGRFEQVDSSNARDKGGSGLGLAICRSIIEQHGGQVWVESTLGQGSTFSFTLPLLAAGDQPADRPHATTLRNIAQ